MIDLPAPHDVKVDQAYRIVNEKFSDLAATPVDEFLEDGRTLQKWIADVVAAQGYEPPTAPLLAQLSELSSRLIMVALMRGHAYRVSEYLYEASIALERMDSQIASYASMLEPCDEHGNLTYGGICMRPWPCSP